MAMSIYINVQFLASSVFGFPIWVSILPSSTSQVSHQSIKLFSFIYDRSKHDKSAIEFNKPVFGVCEQQRPRPACASAQTDQHLCYSPFGKCHI